MTWERSRSFLPEKGWFTEDTKTMSSGSSRTLIHLSSYIRLSRKYTMSMALLFIMSSRVPGESVMMLTFTRGYRRWYSFNKGGKMDAQMDSMVPRHRLPVSSVASVTASLAHSRSRMMAAACSKNTAPWWVKVVCLPMRSNRWTFSSFSSCLTWMVTAAWEYPSCLAAFEKLFS